LFRAAGVLDHVDVELILGDVLERIRKCSFAQDSAARRTRVAYS
jgi:hypothetical protein